MAASVTSVWWAVPWAPSHRLQVIISLVILSSRLWFCASSRVTPFNPLCPGRTESVSEDFKLNMAAPASSHMVGRCFDATEAGSYFDGTGYLKAGEMRLKRWVSDCRSSLRHSNCSCSEHESVYLVASYRVGLDLSISLEFRTSRTNGVLLGISNQANEGLGLEIVQGKVSQ